MLKEKFGIEAVVAGIVTYNPNIFRLEDNIRELSKQVKNIVIVDNGSMNKEELRTVCKTVYNTKITIIYNKKNDGIANALSQIIDFAFNNSYKWVLTLDQDSVIEPGLVEKYIKTANDKKNQDVAMITCLIHDRNFKDEKYELQKETIINVPYCITSASFTNVLKYKQTRGYDKAFFIDCVDFDICYQLREAGFRVVRINYNGLYHEVGHGENRLFFGKKIVVYHQKPFRIYYLTRNTVWMWKKHGKKYGFIKMCQKLIAIYIKIVLYEDHKKEKLKNFWKGLYESKSYKK